MKKETTMNRRKFFGLSLFGSVFSAVASFNLFKRKDIKSELPDIDYSIALFIRENQNYVHQKEWILTKDEYGTPTYLPLNRGFCSLEQAVEFIEGHKESQTSNELIYHIFYQQGNIAYDVVGFLWFRKNDNQSVKWIAKKPYTNYYKIEIS